jgi:hypothetical protein
MNGIIKQVKHILSKSECDTIIQWAKPNLQKSTVVDLDESGEINSKDKDNLNFRVDGFNRIGKGRTNSEAHFNDIDIKSAYIPKINYKIKSLEKDIKKKIAYFTQTPIENQEGITVLHYDVGQFYKAHYDWFTRGTKYFKEQEIPAGGQRIYSVLIYLNNVEEGGETEYPNIFRKIKPEVGKMLIHKNTENGIELAESLHAALPPISGEKWALVCWIRENAVMRFPSIWPYEHGENY